MNKLTVAGVPEHFNLPWHLAFEQLDGMDLQWIDAPGGTGEMCRLLRSGEADLAVVLTEGILKDIADGSNAEVLEVFVSSPLNWGVHVHTTTSFQNIADLKGRNAAISRFGSGSHLMVRVLAANEGWEESDLSYVVVGDLPGGLTALEKGDADYFLWEKYTTNPWVKRGMLRRIAEVPTPWPCFVIAASETAKTHKMHLIGPLLQKVREKAVFVKNDPKAIPMLVSKYQLSHEDVEAWRFQTTWFGMPWNPDLKNRISDKLRLFGIIK